MKKIEIYETTDGTRFDDEERCREYQDVVNYVNDICRLRTGDAIVSLIEFLDTRPRTIAKTMDYDIVYDSFIGKHDICSQYILKALNGRFKAWLNPSLDKPIEFKLDD